jgi:hypothetical protein
VLAGQTVVSRVPLVTAEALPTGSILRRITDTVALWFS